MTDIKNVSYAGQPISNTAMYITKKVEHLLANLEPVEGCLVFAEDCINVPEALAKKHHFVMTKTPQRDYAQFVNEIAENKQEANKCRKYTLTEGGYYIGEGAVIGANAQIEAGAFIDHDVIIGNNAVIKSGARIREAVIGDGFIACENCTVGTSGFTMAEDEGGNKIRIPTLGKVKIGNHVEIGALTNVSCGSAGNTVLEEGAYVGVNATLRNRIHIGKNAFIGMGAVVTKSVEDGITVVGNPAKPFIKK